MVLRQRLFERLDANLVNPLTVISAPAGFGKTTLVTSWLDRTVSENSRAVAWLSVDANHSAPHEFFAALIAAIENAFPGACADVRPLLHSGQTQALWQIPTTIAQACVTWPGKLVLILDDYHLITNADVHAAMSYLIEHWHERVHVIIVTRADPPLRIPQLRAQRKLAEVRTHDLQFELDDVAAFVRKSYAGAAPDALLQALHDRTEGWAAGLRLAVASLQQRADIESFVREFERNSNRYIMDYLMDEVLRAQPAEMQAFLQHTSVLSRMCAALCAVAVEPLDAPACQAMLEQLEVRNLFIVNLDDHRGWYRYHHQFQALLLKQLRMRLGDAGIIQLRQRAAVWLATNGYPDEAINEFVALSEFDQAAQVIEDNLVALQNDEQWSRLSQWLDKMPQAIIDQQPGLLIALGWVKRFHDADGEIKGLAARAEQQLDEMDEVTRSYWQAQLLALKTSRGVTAIEADRADIARNARELAQRGQIWVRTYALMNEAFAHQSMGNVAVAVNVLNDALDDPDFISGKSLARLHISASFVHYSESELPSVYWHAQRCRDFSTRHHMPMTASWGDCMLGLARFHQNDLQEAERHFRAVLDARYAANHQAVALSAHGLLSILSERSDVDTAQRVVNAMRELETSAGQLVDTRVSTALAAYLNLCQDDLKSAAAWAHSIAVERQWDIRGDNPVLSVLLNVLIAQNSNTSLNRAQTILVTALEYSQSVIDRRFHNEALVWLARVLWAQNRQAEALDALADAVAFAQPRGIVRWFAEGGEGVRELLTQLVDAGRYAGEAAAVLAAITPSTPSSQPPSADGMAPGPQVDIDSFTNRESELLELLAARLTNKEIASKLMISPNTVRNHTIRIYRKLNVTTRRQAVQQAMARGLIH